MRGIAKFFRVSCVPGEVLGVYWTPGSPLGTQSHSSVQVKTGKQKHNSYNNNNIHKDSLPQCTQLISDGPDRRSSREELRARVLTQCIMLPLLFEQDVCVSLCV